ncbi:MAG: family 20 glycosylhydrolase [Victivallaceae bacterium]|nr:family 20 glycosylhydrolase [Victivallaceae bacterium]
MPTKNSQSANSLRNIIPAPLEVSDSGGSFNPSQLCSFHIDELYFSLKKEFVEMCAGYRMELHETPENSAQIILKRNAGYSEEEWSANISDMKITLESSDLNGMRYALTALRQMFAIAFNCGAHYAELACGKIHDQPRFGWRGFMLDSARHFQSVETIKGILNVLAAWRINRFHWHLTDNSGWRLELDSVSSLVEDFELDRGSYSKAQVLEVISHATAKGITVIPEFDIPGHSRCIIKKYPNLTCGENPESREICIGSRQARKFIKNILSEIIDLFAENPYIHIGGDEAKTTNWDKCLVCQAAIEEKKFSNSRELEHDFMQEMTRFVVSKGRTPIVWGICSDLTYPPDTIVQCWLDIREPVRVAQNGNKTIYSVHNSLYFDYPAVPSEPHESWMFELSERGVYMTDPHIIWPEKVADSVLGTEACLWTEFVPEWRIFSKIIERLPAYSECAWSQNKNKEWSDFQRRKDNLLAAGLISDL